MNEFNIINKYLKPLALNNLGAYNLDDDIFYDRKKNLAISVDTYTEGVHFLFPSKPDFFVKKIVRASLSDLYCKGVKPHTYFISLGLNKKFAKDSWLKKFKSLLNLEQKKFDIKLGGGDTIYSSKLIITIITIGYSKIRPILRNGASINDDLYVTGSIGDSFIGLNIIKKKYNFGKYNNYFKKNYYEPNLPIKIHSYLGKYATSSIDISDGISQDLKNICKSSNVGAFVNLDLLPLSEFCRILIKKNKINFKNIFSKGDDYQILFTSKQNNRNLISNMAKKINTKITRIGKVTKKNDIIFEYKKKNVKFNGLKMGYTHNF